MKDLLDHKVEDVRDLESLDSVGLLAIGMDWRARRALKCYGVYAPKKGSEWVTRVKKLYLEGSPPWSDQCPVIGGTDGQTISQMAPPETNY